MLITVVTVMLTAMAIVKERESGTIEQIVVSPIKPVEFILGKTILFAIIGLIDIIVVSIVTILWFEIPFNGSFIFLIVTGFFHIVTVLSVGIFISSISKTQQQAMLSVFLFIIPAILLSGFIFPIYAMPEPAQILTYINPLRYFMTILRGIFLKGTGFIELWSDLVALIVFAVVLTIFSSRRLSRRLG
jgi:ABC-2 type transport system permease protein